MSANTKIEWATHTWNPWEGCTKVSPGCANCYAAVRNHRFGMDNWGAGKPRRRTSAKAWETPERWHQECWQKYAGMDHRPRVFPSLCDWLDDEAPIEWFADFLALIYRTEEIDWLLLTKRPELFEKRLLAAQAFWAARGIGEPEFEFVEDWLNGKAPQQVWVGVSVEDQKRADERVPMLLNIPAVIRFLSCEPLLGTIRLFFKPWPPVAVVDWIIVGGESGPKARPCDVRDIMVLIFQGKDFGIPVFVKQLGSRPMNRNGRLPLKHHKGCDPEEWPAMLRVRQFPEAPSPLSVPLAEILVARRNKHAE